MECCVLLEFSFPFPIRTHRDMLATSFILLALVASAQSDCDRIAPPRRKVYERVEAICGEGTTGIRDPHGSALSMDTNQNVHYRVDGYSIILVIRNATVNEAGTYHCVVGEEDCSEIIVDIYNLQFINEESERNQTIQFRKESVIKCTILSEPIDARTDWYFNDNPIHAAFPSQDKYVKGTDLVVRKPSTEDEGRYRCQAVLRAYSILEDLTIYVQVLQGELTCARCTHSTQGEIYDDPCISGGADELETISCFSKCVTVEGQGESDTGKMNHFVLRDCADLLPEEYQMNGDLDHSMLTKIQDVYDLNSTRLRSGRLSLCDTDTCNISPTEYERRGPHVTPGNFAGKWTVTSLWLTCLSLTFVLMTLFM